jgi:ubiquinone biosynthesis protein
MQLSNVIGSRSRFAGNIARAADVATILAKYGLAGWMADVEWEPIHKALKTEGGEVIASHPFEARVRLALIDLGTTFIKLGQMLSTRSDLVGKPMATELRKLLDQAPADPEETAIRVVEAELGRPVGECFKHFDGKAIASASIGQVHRARLTSGRLAAVKVQHPGIEGVIRRDLDILRYLAEIAEKNETLRRYQPVALVREFSRTMLNELDFRRELRNLQIFRRNFAKDETIAFPRPYPEFTSGRTLTMEYMKGVSVTDAKRIAKLGLDPSELAKRGAEVFIRMIFRDGFYHADPHPGNFLVLPDGRIGLLDAGMVGRIDDALARQIEDILLAAGDRDTVRLTDAVIRVCGTPAGLDRAALSTDLSEFFQEYGTQDLSRFDVGGALTAVTEMLHEHQMVLPSKLSMLIKCLALLEGTGRLMSPGFSLAELLEPWRKKLISRRYSPEAQIKSARRLLVDLERTVEALPMFISRIMERVDSGKAIVRLEHRHLKQAANRLVFGLIISGLLVSSSILMATHVPPEVRKLSIPGLLGYLIAAGLGFRSLWKNRDSRLPGRDSDYD